MCLNKETLFQDFKILYTFRSEPFIVSNMLNVFFLFNKKELFYSEIYETVKKVNPLIPVIISIFQKNAYGVNI